MKLTTEKLKKLILKEMSSMYEMDHMNEEGYMNEAEMDFEPRYDQSNPASSIQRMIADALREAMKLGADNANPRERGIDIDAGMLERWPNETAAALADKIVKNLM